MRYCDFCWEVVLGLTQEHHCLFLDLLSVLGKATLSALGTPAVCLLTGQLTCRRCTGLYEAAVVPKKRYRLFLIKNENFRFHCAFLSWKTALRVLRVRFCALPVHQSCETGGSQPVIYQLAFYTSVTYWHLSTYLSPIKHPSTRLSPTDHLPIHPFLIEQEVDLTEPWKGDMFRVVLQIQLCWDLHIGAVLWCRRRLIVSEVAELKLFSSGTRPGVWTSLTSEERSPRHADAVCVPSVTWLSACPHGSWLEVSKCCSVYGDGNTVPQWPCGPAAVTLSACDSPR